MAEIIDGKKISQELKDDVKAALKAYLDFVIERKS